MMQDRCMFASLRGTGSLGGEAGHYGPAEYDLDLMRADAEHVFDAAVIPLDGLYLDGSIKIERGMNLLQTLSMTLTLEDGRRVEVLSADGDPLAADWGIIAIPEDLTQFQ